MAWRLPFGVLGAFLREKSMEDFDKFIDRVGFENKVQYAHILHGLNIFRANVTGGNDDGGVWPDGPDLPGKLSAGKAKH